MPGDTVPNYINEGRAAAPIEARRPLHPTPSHPNHLTLVRHVPSHHCVCTATLVEPSTVPVLSVKRTNTLDVAGAKGIGAVAVTKTE